MCVLLSVIYIYRCYIYTFEDIGALPGPGVPHADGLVPGPGDQRRPGEIHRIYTLCVI